MTKPRKKPKQSLFRRLIYLLMIVSGGGVGIGGWTFKDHPQVQALWTLVTGQTVDAGDTPKLDGSLVTAVIDTLKPRDEFSQPGIYQVTIPKIQLDPALFKMGHTVDIQAKVTKLDPSGRDSTLWESKAYGERLAVAGKDDLTAGWPHRPFQVEWNTGEQIVVEVFDRKTGLFMEPKKFILAPADVAPREFPLKTGTFPLEPAQKPNPPADPRNTTIVFQSQRVGDLQQTPSAGEPRQESQRIGNAGAQSRGDAADSPIIIK
jgi:hypothetical protein